MNTPPLSDEVTQAINVLYPLFEAEMRKEYFTCPNKIEIVLWHRWLQNRGFKIMKDINKALKKRGRVKDK